MSSIGKCRKFASYAKFHQYLIIYNKSEDNSMKKYLTTGVAVVAILSATAALADNHADMDMASEARGNAMKLGKDLKLTLQSAMKSGGPVAAVKACNVSAPSIANKINMDTGWQVGRSSLKLRNPANAPDSWEKKVMETFEERKAAGESPKTLEYSETVMVDGQKTFRFMKAIPTAKICLNCHGGEQVKAPIAGILKELYPADKARGYNEGDLRGAFTLSKTL
jgi:hypothetical protein